MQGKKKIAAAGHICLDITPVFPANTAGTVAEILKPGRLLHMDGVDVHTGGSAANTGLALKLMGADVRILEKWGRIPLDGSWAPCWSSTGCGTD